MYIDCHAHLRDEEQAEKETIAHGLDVARDSGVNAVFDMPNPRRPVYDLQRARDRLDIAKRANRPEIFYGTFIGLTKDREQIKGAVSAYDKLFPYVVGFKLYGANSTGNLGVIHIEDQAVVYETLSTLGYEGVLFVHPEKESEMYDKIGNLFVPSNPISHCLARPWQSEYASVKDQIDLATRYKFGGKLHMAHISHPKSVELVINAKKKGLDISCGVCPHHLIYDYTKMQEKDGILWKMNPPLREPGVPSQMLEHLRNGNIDWIETDHAPHTFGDKTSGSDDGSNGWASGIPGLPWWPLYEEMLRREGFSDKQILRVTFDNIAERFNISVGTQKRAIVDRTGDYSFNPHKQLEESLGWWNK